MVGITSYGAYIPYYRLPRSVIGAAWGRPGGRSGEKAVANFDEDPLSMSVTAAIDCLKGTDPKTVDALFMATTCAPYSERLNANIMAKALDLRQETRNADFTGSLRAGTIALLSAIDAIKAGSAKKVLVTASDMRLGGAAGENEQVFGDGAAALLIGDEKVAAEIECTYTLSVDFVDYWRASGDTFVRSWEDRFGLDEGYNKINVEAVNGIMEKSGLAVKDFAKVCFNGPNSRRHGALGKKMGFDPAQVQESLLDVVGNAGTALSLMILVSALEQAKAGDRILVVNWGNGTDTVVLRVTEEIENIRDRRGIKGHLQIKRTLDNYGKYLRWRQLAPIEPAARPDPAMTSMSALWREGKTGIPLYGVTCKNCGTIQLVGRARICLECHTKDQFEPYRFSDKTAKVTTFSHDYLGGGLDPPSTGAVIDFEGGGRGTFNITDRDPDEIKVGMDVEMTFRHTGFIKGVHNYYWKCKPQRD